MKNFFKYPWLIIAVIGVITVFFALRLPHAELDNNNMRFVPEDDEARVTSAYIDDTFGSSLFILVGLEPNDGSVFNPDFLRQIKAYVDRIEGIPIVGNINSIINADYITSEEDSIVVEKLVSDDFSGSAEDIAELKRRLLSWDLYRNALISDDFSATQILVPLEISSDDTGKSEIIAEYMQVRDIAHEMFGDNAAVYVTGIPVISATISEAMGADFVVLIPLVLIVVLLSLFFSFRRFTAVLLPLITVIVATVWSMGAMPLLGFKLTILSSVLPVILIAVGSAYGIHLVTHYLDDTKSIAALSREEHNELIFALIRRMVKPVFLAALTTFAGFVSFCFTRVVPIREWGFFASFGVIASFAIAITLIPALLIIRGPKPMKELRLGKKSSGDAWDTSLPRIFIAVTKKKQLSLAITALVLIVSLYGVSKVVIDNVFVEYFKPDTGIAQSDRFIREKFGGSKVVNIIMEAGNSEDLLHPDSLTAMDSLGVYLEKSVPEAGKTLAFTDLIKRINQVFNADESPIGLQTAGLKTDGGFTYEKKDDFGFGFDDANTGETGFGFGFNDEAISPGIDGNPLNAAGSVSGSDKNGLSEVYTAGKLMALFDRAISEGGRTMNAGELTDVLKRFVNYNGASYYEIPADPARYGKKNKSELGDIVSNYLVLLSGNIDSYADDPIEPTAIKMAVQLRTTGEKDTGGAITAINRYIKTHFPQNIKTTVGGSAMVESSLNTLVVESQLVSVFISLIIVFIIITISNKSVIAGFIGLISLVISILINFAVMGFLKIKLNIGTSLVASLAVGIGIDYTIHFLETYKSESRNSGGQGEFLRRVFATSGKAILINAISVGLGFAVLMLSQFIILRDLGLLIALTMLVSAFVSLTVIPILLTLLKPKFIYKEGNGPGLAIKLTTSTAFFCDLMNS
jgi:predicted RND superfamily exporter protein